MNHASALGQAVGKLFETRLIERLRPVVTEREHSIGPQRMINGADNIYQIDAVVADAQSRPIIIMDVKYLRYTKHNRDKGSWIFTAHYNLYKTHPSIRKSIAVLIGNWSSPSVSLIKSAGIQVVRRSFEDVVRILEDYGVAFDWPERDSTIPAQAWAKYQNLPDQVLRQIADRLTNGIVDEVARSITDVLDTNTESIAKRVSSVEVILKTSADEMLLLQSNTVTGAVTQLMGFLHDSSDIRTAIGQVSRSDPWPPA